MSWSQFLAAIGAAVIPIVVKLLNDYADRLKADQAKPAPAPSPDPGGSDVAHPA